MDTILTYNAVEKLVVGKNEQFQSSNDSEGGASIGSIIGFVIGTLLGFVAVYLSWSCNTKEGYSTGLKILYAILAFIFSTLYIIFWLIFRWGTCSRLP